MASNDDDIPEAQGGRLVRLIRQFARFSLMGFVNVAVNYVVFAASILAGAAVSMALAGGTVTSVLFAYFVGGRIVFGNRGLGKLPAFIAAYALSYLANLALLKFIITLGVHPLLAQLIAIPFIVVLNFTLLQFLVFRRKAVATKPQ